MKEVPDERLLECDFCGIYTDEIKRVVLDVEYDRVLAKVLYACTDCSYKKELERKSNGK